MIKITSWSNPKVHNGYKSNIFHWSHYHFLFYVIFCFFIILSKFYDNSSVSGDKTISINAPFIHIFRILARFLWLWSAAMTCPIFIENFYQNLLFYTIELPAL